MQHGTAIVIGATGLVGSELVQLLLQDQRFSLVKILVRRSTHLHHTKLEEHIINFDAPGTWKHLVKGDVLFSALGTTLKTAGSKEAQYKVDYHYQLNVASAAAENRVPVYVLVSSAMADPHSRIFYTRMKGELEREVKQLDFEHIHILQPGMLDGDRRENRPGEKTGRSIIQFLNRLGLLKQQKPIHARIVARAMINAAFSYQENIKVYKLLEVFELAGEKVQSAG